MMKKQTLSERTPLLSRAVTAAAVILSSVLIGVLTVTKNHTLLFSPFSDSAEDTMKARITEAFEDSLVGFDRFLALYGFTQRVLGTSVYEDAGYDYLIRDQADFLHFHTPRADAAPYADSVIRLYETLLQNDIPLLYLQAPTKEIDGFTQYPAGISYRSTENSADMANRLQTAGVPVLSLAKVLDGTLEPASRFYRTDHHWTTQAAFTAFSAVLPYLNDTYGFSLDTSLCRTENWKTLYQPSSFLGSIGRRVGEELASPDDYTYFEPLFETSYQIYYPPESTETPYWVGSFHHTIVRDKLLYADDVKANRYASYFQYDYGELIIENLLCENDLHIAIIKDSFALPFTAFLSTAVSGIDMIDLREFEGSVTDHLLATKPDLVLILYSNGTFSPSMYHFDKKS